MNNIHSTFILRYILMHCQLNFVSCFWFHSFILILHVFYHRVTSVTVINISSYWIFHYHNNHNWDILSEILLWWIYFEGNTRHEISAIPPNICSSLFFVEWTRALPLTYGGGDSLVYIRVSLNNDLLTIYPSFSRSQIENRDRIIICSWDWE